MRTVSWVLLLLVGLATLLGSLASARVAYLTEQDQIGPVSLTELTTGRSDVAAALRARRGTAAAYGAAYAVLFLLIVLGPYRRGEGWSAWAILVGTLVLAIVTLARIPFLGTRLGVTTALIQAGIVGLALLLGWPLSRAASSSAD